MGMLKAMRGAMGMAASSMARAKCLSTGMRALSTATTQAGQEGIIWAWGHSDDGMIRVPQSYSQLGLCTQVSCGLYHVGATTVDGVLHTWGRGEGGRLGNREEEFSVNRGGAIPLHAPDPHPVDFGPPLREFGLQDNEMPVVVGAACGGLHTLALMSDGRVMSFGFGRFGQLGLGFTGAAVLYTPLQLLTLKPAISIAAGGSHSAAVTTDGEVYTWGRSETGRLGYRDHRDLEHQPKCVVLLSNLGIGSAYCGGFHSAALTKDGKKLFMWGAGENGELGTGNPVNEQEPKLVQELEGERLVSVSLGGFHTAAVTEKGDVLTWGLGSIGQLGHLNSQKQPLPKRVLGIPPAVQVACGGGHTVVVTKSGELWAWGTNGDGQLGVHCMASRTPVMVESLAHKRALSVAAGGPRTAVIVHP